MANENDRRRFPQDDRWKLPGHGGNIDGYQISLGRFVGILMIVVGVVGFGVMWGGRHIRSEANRMAMSGKFGQLQLAAHNYLDTYDQFPANTHDANGKPLLSWRVHLLPHMEGERLYRQFHLDEPWDSPHNLSLLDQMPSYYARPSDRTAEQRGNKSFIRAFSTPGAVMAKMQPAFVPKTPVGRLRFGIGFDEVTDNRSETILFIEAGEAVEWTKPDDLTWDIGQLFPALGGDRDTKEFQAAFVVGPVRSLKKSITPEQLKALITISGGEQVRIEELVK